MEQEISTFEGRIYAVMRMVTGFLFLWHGSQKLLGFPAPGHDMAAHVQYVAGPIELVCGFLIMVGLWTRPAAFLASGLMAFAYWMVHGTKALLPILNRGELAALYCFVFLYICVRGAGPWSLGQALKKNRSA
jgi:putative oxidoreductase